MTFLFFFLKAKKVAANCPNVQIFIKYYDIYIYIIDIMVRVFPRSIECSMPGRVIPKTQKMVLDASLLNTQHYKVWIKGKVEQSWEWSNALPYTLV